MSTKKKSTLSKTDIIYGVFDDWLSCLTLHHLIFFRKILYVNTLDVKRPQFADFIFLIQNKIDIENSQSRRRPAFVKFLDVYN